MIPARHKKSLRHCLPVTSKKPKLSLTWVPPQSHIPVHIIIGLDLRTSIYYFVCFVVFTQVGRVWRKEKASHMSITQTDPENAKKRETPERDPLPTLNTFLSSSPLGSLGKLIWRVLDHKLAKKRNKKYYFSFCWLKNKGRRDAAGLCTSI